MKYKVRVFEVSAGHTQEVYGCSEEPSADEPSADILTPAGAAMTAALAVVSGDKVKRAGTLHVLVSEGTAWWGYGVPVVLAISETAKPLTKGEVERLVRVSEVMQ